MAEAPLKGLRVVELARILAGPWIGQTLADLGAEVVAEPLGVHPGLVDLVLRRYDEGCRASFPATTLSGS